MTQDNFSHFASILPVADVAASLAYYRDQLGFTVEFTWNDPVDYAVLRRGGVSIHLSRRIDAGRPSPKHAVLYAFVHDADQLYQEYRSKDVAIETPLGTRDYGMKDFDVRDPEGYLLTFGQGVE